MASLDGSTLAAMLGDYEAALAVTYRPQMFANLALSTDALDEPTRALHSRVGERSNGVFNQLRFVDLELGRASTEVCDRWLADPALSNYRHHLARARDAAPHALPGPVEEALSTKDLTGRRAWTQLYDEHLAAWRFEVKVNGEARTLALRVHRLASVPNAAHDEGNWLLAAWERAHGPPVPLPPDARFVTDLFAWMMALALRLGGESIASARSVPVAAALWLEDLAGRPGVELRLSDETDTPLTVGVLRPVILVPRRMLDVPASERRALLAHELAHVARADCLLLLAGAVVRALYWISPLPWWALRSLRARAEDAADDAALRTGIRSSSYAAQLVALARKRLGRACPAPAAGLRDRDGSSGSFVGQQIEGRVRWQVFPKSLALDVGALTVRAEGPGRVDVGGRVRALDVALGSIGGVGASAVDGRVRFTRADAGHGWAFTETEVEGRNPLGDQATDRFVGLGTEVANPYPDRTVNAYPHAYEMVAQIFDHPAAPDVPSLTELGYPAVTPGLNGVYAPAGTSRAATTRPSPTPPRALRSATGSGSAATSTSSSG